ncbi:hypothetical protein G9A89_000209 [Geosiphon pyriformis]|nr:hypothetical protein G9A89_000209 [Geosiphon pyriformis]
MTENKNSQRLKPISRKNSNLNLFAKLKRKRDRESGTKILISPKSSLTASFKLHAFYAQKAYCLDAKEDRLAGGVFAGFEKMGETTLIIYFRRLGIDWQSSKKTMRQYSNVEGARVDTTLYEEFLFAKDRFFERIKEYLKENPEIKKIRFTGHYLGGVLALLAAVEYHKVQKDEIFPIKSDVEIGGQNSYSSSIWGLNKNPSGRILIDIQVFTYGAPRFGNRGFAQHVDNILQGFDYDHGQLTQKSFRITYMDDFVPQFPERNEKFPYFHHLKEYWIGDDRCECGVEQWNLYLCLGTLDSQGFVEEPQECNKRAQETTINPREQRLGPYFGYFMGKCTERADKELINHLSDNSRKVPIFENFQHNETSKPNSSSILPEKNLSIIKRIENFTTKRLLDRSDNRLKKFQFHAYYASKAYCLHSKEYRLAGGVYAGFEMHSPQTLIIYFQRIGFSWIPSIKRFQPYTSLNGGEVESTLLNEFLLSRAKFVEKITSFLIRYPKLQKISFTGHFLGGVLAVLGAIEYKKIQSLYQKMRQNPSAEYRLFYKPSGYKFNPSDILLMKSNLEIQIVTFGSPRIGNWQFANFMDKLLNTPLKNGKRKQMIYRITFMDDYIPQFMPYNGLEEYFHHITEFWINDGSCECDRLNELEVYECLGDKNFNIVLEPKDCNQRANQESQNTDQARLGPYFGYMMGSCNKDILAPNFPKDYLSLEYSFLKFKVQTLQPLIHAFLRTYHLSMIGIFYRCRINGIKRIEDNESPIKSAKRFSDQNSDTTSNIPLSDYIKETCPSLVGPLAKFYPTVWLANGHLQTAYAAYAKFLNYYPVKYERHFIPTPDGGQFTLDWTPPIFEKPFDDTPTLVILHGLTGGSHESYIRSLLDILTRPPHNYRGVVFNFRGCADSELLSPQMYCAGYTDDLRVALRYIEKCIPNAKLMGAGFSLGANILVKYLGEEGTKTPLIGAISVGNPFDLLGTNLAMERSLVGRKIYSTSLALNLKNSFAKHLKILKRHPKLDPPFILSARSIREFDDRCTRLVFGYDTVNDYYRDASSSRFVTRVRVPLLCLQARDDPVSVRECIPYDECRFNPSVILATTSHGGHLGWFTGFWRPTRWCIKPLTEFCVAMFETENNSKDTLSTVGNQNI